MQFDLRKPAPSYREGLLEFSLSARTCRRTQVSRWSATMWQVNVMGVVRSLQALVPGMLRQPDPGHIVITSSIMGFTGGQTSIYGTSKHAVTRIAEGLHHDLIAIGAPIGVTLLCPGAIATQLMLSERNRTVCRSRRRSISIFRPTVARRRWPRRQPSTPLSTISSTHSLMPMPGRTWKLAWPTCARPGH